MKDYPNIACEATISEASVNRMEGIIQNTPP